MRIFLLAGPWVILLVWYGAGQWTLAGDEARAWLMLLGAVGLAALLPLPGGAGAPGARSRPQPDSWPLRWLHRLRPWGWAAVGGLIAIS